MTTTSASAAAVAPRPTEVSFAVPGNPLSQNRAWTIITWKPKAGSGMRPHSSLKLTAEGEAWKAQVARLARASRPADWDLENQYIVECLYYFDSRRPDCDGPGKLTLDALEGVLLRNDRQVWRFIQQKERDVDYPRAIITVTLRRAPSAQQGALL